MSLSRMVELLRQNQITYTEKQRHTAAAYLRKYGDQAAIRVYELGQPTDGLLRIALRLIHNILVEWDHINALRKTYIGL